MNAAHPKTSAGASLGTVPLAEPRGAPDGQHNNEQSQTCFAKVARMLIAPARGFVFNADLVAVTRFLEIGTRVASSVR